MVHDSQMFTNVPGARPKLFYNLEKMWWLEIAFVSQTTFADFYSEFVGFWLLKISSQNLNLSNFG